MNLLIFLHPDDAPGLAALLNRMHMWGQLNWYDCDAIFKDVEEPQQRMFFVFPLPGMDWRTFADLFERLTEEKSKPIKRFDILTIDVILEASRASLSAGKFLERIRERGAP